MSKQNSFAACKTLVELMRELKRVAVLFPVPGGHYHIFAQAKKEYLDALQDPRFELSKLPEWAQQDYIDFPEVLDQLVRLKELDLEMIGSWLWVSGYTWKYKDQLKDLGLQFAPDKKLWYFRPADERSGNSSPMPIDLIREKYGSDSAPEKPFVFDQQDKEEQEAVAVPTYKMRRHESFKRTPVRTFQRP